MDSRLLAFIVLSIACCAANLASAIEYAPIVRTETGLVRGVVEVLATSNRKVNLYQGIKYGEAKRFGKPVKSQSWNGVYDASTVTFACPQPGVPLASDTTSRRSGSQRGLLASEDCLYLNVFQPVLNSSEKLPVMFWIHGGTFWSGSSFDKAFDAKYIADIGSVVVVTANYRLGAFGFLTGDDEHHPGNQGLFDLVCALEWIQTNIEHFNGSPRQVTVFGESAGAMATSALLLSPLTKGLIHRAILQSGAVSSFIGSESKTKAWAKVKYLASFLNCQQNSTAAMVACIETKSTKEIQDVVNIMGRLGQFFEPSYGTEFLSHSSVQLLKAGQFNAEIDLLFGVNRDEGASGVYGLFSAIRPDSGKNITLDNVRDFIKQMAEVFGLTAPGLADEVADWYSARLNESDQVALRNAVANMYGDFNLVCPTMFFGQQFAKAAPSSSRQFSYRLVQPISHGSGGCEEWMGVCHAMDLKYVFGHPIDGNSTGRFTERDFQLSFDVIRSWTDFAAGKSLKMGQVRWEEAFPNGNYTLESHQLMWLDVDHYRMVPGFFKHLCDDFWRARIF